MSDQYIPPELIDIVVSYVVDNSPWYFVSKQCAVMARKNRVGLKLSCKLGRWVDIHSRLNIDRQFKAEYYIYKYRHSKLFRAISTHTACERRECGIMRSGDLDLMNIRILGPSTLKIRIDLKPTFRSSKHVSAAAKSGNIDMLRAVMDIRASGVDYGKAIFHAAKLKGKTRNDKYNAILTLLSNYNKKQNQTDSLLRIVYGLTASGNVKMLKSFIDSNDVIYTTGAVSFIVMYACRSGNMNMLTYILSKYPVTNKESVTHIVSGACRGGNVQIVKFVMNLFKDQLENSSLYINHEILLPAVCKRDYVEIAKILDEYKLFNHGTCARYAAKFGAFNILRYVIGKCAKYDLKSALLDVIDWDDKAMADEILSHLIK